MKVKGKTTVEVEIDQSEAKRITVRTLRDTFGWPDGAYIDVNGNLIVEHDTHTSHSFVNNIEIIRKATEEDFTLRNIIHSLCKKRDQHSYMAKTTTRTKRATIKSGNVTIRKTLTVSKTVKTPKVKKSKKK